jgi:hypothetical protein
MNFNTINLRINEVFGGMKRPRFVGYERLQLDHQTFRFSNNYNIDFIIVFILSLLLYVVISILLILDVITILSYCPLLSSRGNP